MVPAICGFGSEWDAVRRQTKFWVELDNGAGYAAYGDRLPEARLALAQELASIGLALPTLGPYGAELASEVEAWQRQIARFPGGQPAAPAYDYGRAMVHGAPITLQFAEGPSEGRVAVEEIGQLTLKRGRLAAFDPYSSPAAPFSRAVAPGKYPVRVAWAEAPGEPRRRSALAWVSFSAEPVDRWEQALTAEQDIAQLTPGDMFGCPVDSGCACFTDADSRVDPTRLAESFAESAAIKDKLVAFTTGWGDGQYACFWGLDTAGQPAVLVMDVELVPYL